MPKTSLSTKAKIKLMTLSCLDLTTCKLKFYKLKESGWAGYQNPRYNSLTRYCLYQSKIFVCFLKYLITNHKGQGLQLVLPSFNPPVIFNQSSDLTKNLSIVA